MVGATASGVTVCCPECGGPLRVSFADGGSIVGCHRCGEAVRVPARPHPVETPAEALSPIPPGAARRAARGVRMLQLSLGLFAVEHLLLVAAVGVAAFVPVAGWGPWLGLALGLDVGLLTARTVLRWTGYRRCESAASAAAADGWVRWARVAVAVRLAGYLAIVGPWAAGWRPADLRTIAPLASVAWSVGGMLEFVAVAAWGRLLVALGDRYAAGRTARYAVLVGVMVATVTVGLMLARLAVVLAARRIDPNPPPAGWATIPPEAWPAVGGFGLVAGVLTAVAWMYYARILFTLRERLRTS